MPDTPPSRYGRHQAYQPGSRNLDVERKRSRADWRNQGNAHGRTVAPGGGSPGLPAQALTCGLAQPGQRSRADGRTGRRESRLAGASAHGRTGATRATLAGGRSNRAAGVPACRRKRSRADWRNQGNARGRTVEPGGGSPGLPAQALTGGLAQPGQRSRADGRTGRRESRLAGASAHGRTGATRATLAGGRSNRAAGGSRCRRKRSRADWRNQGNAHGRTVEPGGGRLTLPAQALTGGLAQPGQRSRADRRTGRREAHVAGASAHGRTVATIE